MNESHITGFIIGKQLQERYASISTLSTNGSYVFQINEEIPLKNIE